MWRDRREGFETALKAFPSSAHTLLHNLPQQGGMIPQKTCRELMRLLDVSRDMLMIRLLPIARVFSVAPISQFSVGAVALAGKEADEREMNLYLGANMEFKQLALNMTLHAEQGAVMNAWHQGAVRFKSIATSEPPCGHCRQFLSELFDPTELEILEPVPDENACHRSRLSEILPRAMAPGDLGSDSSLATFIPAARKLRLLQHLDDVVVQAALSAAEATYAPYTGNLAGCALYIIDGGIISGRYMESVAFNPSVSPFHSAILQLNLMLIEKKQAIDRIVLVEKPTRIRQKDQVEMLVQSWAPGIKLEYLIAKEEE
jgi:cytidine deaminase